MMALIQREKLQHNKNEMNRRLLLYVALTAVLWLVAGASAQDSTTNAPCGIVDSIDYPLESVETRTLANGYDDFGQFRPRFEGNHVGLDVGFREGGTTVVAAAAGRVTYSDIEGWDTEKGVVVIQHVFPNGDIYYTLYGHMEEAEGVFFPEEGSCVARGEPIGAVGFPSLSAPHLHFEVRDFLPDDGGPGYVEDNPLQRGWRHPLDFTALWRLRLSPGFVGHVTYDLAPSQPPVPLRKDLVATAAGNVVAVTAPPDQPLWRVNLDDIISGVAAAPDGGVIARSRSGQVATLYDGRFAALWSVPGPDIPFAAFNDVYVFVTDQAGLVAYTALGDLLWSTPPPAGAVEGLSLHANAATLALSVETEAGIWWGVFDPTGQLLFETTFDTEPLVAHAQDGAWTLFADGQLMRYANDTLAILANAPTTTGRAAALSVDALGASYWYSGDAQRSLLSWDPAGQPRWTTTLPAGGSRLLAPIVQADSGCILFALDSDGGLSVFDAATGDLIDQVSLYAGGRQSRQPGARAITPVNVTEVQVHAGFLTSVTLDAGVIGSGLLDSCVLG